MTRVFKPRLSVLDPPQRELWDEFSQIPREFALYGGTAIALQLDHRKSVDFDFFSLRAFDPDQLLALPLAANCEILQKAPNTLTLLVNRGDSVQVSFFGVPELCQVAPCQVSADNQLRVASLIDLAGMKAAVVQKRAEAKDYLAIDAIIRLGGISLSEALAAGRVIYQRMFQPELTLKALAYFGDGNLPTIGKEVRARLAAAVRAVDLGALPDLGRFMH